MFTLTMLFAIYRSVPVPFCFGLSRLKGLKHLGMSMHSSPVLIAILLSLWSLSVFLDPLQPYPARLLSPWDFPGKNTRVGCHFLLQGIFLTQGLNTRLLHWQADSLLLSYLGSPHFSYVSLILY